MHLERLAQLACDFLLLDVVEHDQKQDGGERVIPQQPYTVKFEHQFMNKFSLLCQYPHSY